MKLGIYTYTYVGDKSLGDKRPIKLIACKANHVLNAPHSLITNCSTKITLLGGAEVYALDPDKYEYAKEYLSITNDCVYQRDMEVIDELIDIGEEYIAIVEEGGWR